MNELKNFECFTSIQIKKLLIKKRNQIQEQYLTPYQFQVAKDSISLKNRNFIRQLRSHQIQTIKFSRSVNKIDVYINEQNQEFYLLCREDEFHVYQVEYFVNNMQTPSGFLNIKRLLSPQYAFYSPTKSFYLQHINVQTQQIDEILKPQKKSPLVLHKALRVIREILVILFSFHRNGLCLNGDFSPIVCFEGYLRVDLLKAQIRVPATLEEGINADLCALKDDMVMVGHLLNHDFNGQLILQLNDCFSVINDVIQNNNEFSLAFGLPSTQVCSLLLSMPFFCQIKYLPVRLIIAKPPIAAQVVPKPRMPEIKEVELEKEEDEEAIQPPKMFYYQNRCKSAVSYKKSASTPKPDETQCVVPFYMTSAKRSCFSKQRPIKAKQSSNQNTEDEESASIPEQKSRVATPHKLILKAKSIAQTQITPQMLLKQNLIQVQDSSKSSVSQTVAVRTPILGKIKENQKQMIEYARSSVEYNKQQQKRESENERQSFQLSLPKFNSGDEMVQIQLKNIKIGQK